MNQKRPEKKGEYGSDKPTTSITSPDARYKKTGVAKPDDGHVKESMDWSEEHQQ